MNWKLSQKRNHPGNQCKGRQRDRKYKELKDIGDRFQYISIQSYRRKERENTVETIIEQLMTREFSKSNERHPAKDSKTKRIPSKI